MEKQDYIWGFIRIKIYTPYTKRGGNFQHVCLKITSKNVNKFTENEPIISG